MTAAYGVTLLEQQYPYHAVRVGGRVASVAAPWSALRQTTPAGRHPDKRRRPAPA